MFATRIKNLRQSKELNQVQLAEKLGVKKQSVSNWECGYPFCSAERERATDRARRSAKAPPKLRRLKRKEYSSRYD